MSCPLYCSALMTAQWGAAVIIAIVQIRKWVIERSGVSPRVLQIVEELGCESRLVYLVAVLSIVVLIAKLLHRLISIWGSWTPRTSIDGLQKGAGGASPECSKKCAFPLRGVSMHLVRFSDPIDIRTSIPESYSVVRLWQVKERMANWAEQDEDSDWMEQTRIWGWMSSLEVGKGE